MSTIKMTVKSADKNSKMNFEQTSHSWIGEERPQEVYETIFGSILIINPLFDGGEEVTMLAGLGDGESEEVTLGSSCSPSETLRHFGYPARDSEIIKRPFKGTITLVID